MSCPGRRWPTCIAQEYSPGRTPDGSPCSARSDVERPHPDPLPQSGRGGAVTPPRSGAGSGWARWLAALPSVLLLLACSGALLDYAFPPDLSRLVSVGTEILDRHDRPIALLPAEGGVWRFRA